VAGELGNKKSLTVSKPGGAALSGDFPGTRIREQPRRKTLLRTAPTIMSDRVRNHAAFPLGQNLQPGRGGNQAV
jgi:hypothetical protein